MGAAESAQAQAAALNSSERCVIVLVGGGHSHVHALKFFGVNPPPPNVQLICISAENTTWYSGSIPASIAGLYSSQHAQLELNKLAEWGGWKFIKGKVTKIDVEEQSVFINGEIKLR